MKDHFRVSASCQAASYHHSVDYCLSLHNATKMSPNRKLHNINNYTFFCVKLHFFKNLYIVSLHTSLSYNPLCMSCSIRTITYYVLHYYCVQQKCLIMLFLPPISHIAHPFYQYLNVTGHTAWVRERS